MKTGLTIATPHDGVYVDPEITFDTYNNGIRQVVDVYLNDNPIARLSFREHRLWLMNPGLREKLCSYLSALTGGTISFI